MGNLGRGTWMRVGGDDEVMITHAIIPTCAARCTVPGGRSKAPLGSRSHGLWEKCEYVGIGVGLCSLEKGQEILRLKRMAP